MKETHKLFCLFINSEAQTFISAVKKGTVRGTAFPEERENQRNLTGVPGCRKFLGAYCYQRPFSDERYSYFHREKHAVAISCWWQLYPQSASRTKGVDVAQGIGHTNKGGLSKAVGSTLGGWTGSEEVKTCRWFF